MNVIKTVFRRSRVVNDSSDVVRELKYWLAIVVVTLVLVSPVALVHDWLLVTPWLGLVAVVWVGMSWGAYVLAPVLLPLGYEFVCMDMSFGIYGWTRRRAEKS